jgi:nicotinamide mononucleotide transporter
VEWLRSAAITIAGSSVTWLELLGAVTGLASVWWAARERVWTWPVGILNSGLFLLLFLDAGLYATAALQVAFIVLGAYGWREWLRGGGADDDLPVRRTRRAEWIGLAIAAVIGQAAWTTWLVISTDSSVAFWDSAVLVLSLVATFGQARKLIESWWVWILVDTISIPLFLGQGLYLTAALYAVFEVLCIVGLRDWRRSMRRRDEALATAGDRPGGALDPACDPAVDPTVDPPTDPSPAVERR